MSSERPILTNKLCSICSKPVVARNFCVACYYRQLRNGTIDTNSLPPKWKHKLSDIDEVNKTAECTSCGKVSIRSRGDNKWRCKVDANARSKNYKRAYRQCKKNQLGRCCEICGSSKKLCWDHDHTTNEFRGTLCTLCNSAIGFMQESPTCLRKAAEYLETKRSNGTRY